MTAPHPSLEQLSALVDGEDVPSVASHVAACSSCAASIRSLRAARASVAEVPPLAPADVDRLVGVAVAARAVPFRRRTGRVPVLAGVAAALVALLGFGALVAGSARDRGPDDTFAAGGAAATAEGGAADQSAPEAIGPRMAAGAGAGADVADPELVALQDRLAGRAGGAEAPGATAAAALPCAGDAERELGRPADRGWTLRWHGEDAVVHAEDDRRQAVVMRAADCAVLVVLRF